MKRVIVLGVMLFFVACKKEAEKPAEIPSANAKTPELLGQELFEGEGNCVACHKVDQKIIAPSLQEIAKIYKTKKGSIVSFLKEEADPIVDPSQYEVMKVNFGITKAMTEEQLKALEAYILKQ